MRPQSLAAVAWSLCASVLVAGAAMAQTTGASPSLVTPTFKPYVSAILGWEFLANVLAYTSAPQTANGGTSGGYSNGSSSLQISGGSIAVGVDVLPFLSIEGGYTLLCQREWQTSSSSGVDSSGHVFGVGMLRLHPTSDVSVLLKAGVSQQTYQTRYGHRTTGSFSVQPLFGLGVRLNDDGLLSIRIDVDKYKVAETGLPANQTLVSFGVIYRL